VSEETVAGSGVQVEASGETVGEAKWAALRELERRFPGIDKAWVRFQVVSEGERGLLGVGYSPARVMAIAPASAVPKAPVVEEAAEEFEVREDESALAAEVRELVQRITRGVGVDCRITSRETDDEIVATCSGPDLGMLIGRHGQTIDAIQYLVNAVVWREHREERKEVVVDAAGYRDRRRATLEALAVRSAERAVEGRQRVELEPMTAVERKVVHLRLKDYAGVETTSEGTEPNRFVVVLPAPVAD
jgi:spoIIIJ-associated protein